MEVYDCVKREGLTKKKIIIFYSDLSSWNFNTFASKTVEIITY